MLDLVRDIRFALRVLWKTPGLTLAAVLAMALGIGVNTSCFINLNALVLHPLPFPALDRVMTVWETVPKARDQRDSVAPANYLDWCDHASSAFLHTAAVRGWNVTLTGIGDPERVEGYQVTPTLFDVLGMKPERGRAFLPSEAEPGHDGVVIVSHGFWTRRMAAAPDAVGRSITLGGRACTVVGVMPDEFDFPLGADLWAPLAFGNEARSQRSERELMVLGLLRPNSTPGQARAELAVVARDLESRYPRTNQERGVLVIPLRQLTNEVTDRFVMVLMGAAGFVLLLACVNVMNLHLSRVTGREREIAVRTAMGAPGWSIARQLLIESVLVSAVGGALGLVMASWHIEWVRRTIPAQVLRWVSGLRLMHVDATVVAFVVAASLVAGVAGGLPAVLESLRHAASRELSASLKERGRIAATAGGGSRGRLRHALVMGEVALALVLLAGAAAMVRTFQQMLALNAGYNPKGILSMNVALPPAQYRDPAQVRDFYDRVIAGLESIGGVSNAGAVASLGPAAGVSIEGRPQPRPGELSPDVKAVSAHYLETLGIPLIAGRSILPGDTADAPAVAVLSESVVKQYWSSGVSPLGTRIRLHGPASPWITVAGVCGDVRDWFDSKPHPAAYLSYRQAPRASMELVLRAPAGDPARMATAAVARIHEVDRGLPVYDIKTVEQRLAEETSGVRSSAIMMTGYAVIALLLAVTGIYGVVSYSVSQRTHEFGVRLAMGARPAQVIRLTLARTLSLAGIGLGIGFVAAFLLLRLLASALYGVVSVEWFWLPLFAAVLGLSALAAGLVPARRVGRIDPLQALRDE